MGRSCQIVVSIQGVPIAIRQFAFTEFATDDARDEAVGWVNPEDWFDTELTPIAWPVGRFALVESITGQSRSTYDVIDDWPLVP